MPYEEQTASTATSSLHCTSCGAGLHFAPGTRHQKCPYCGAGNEIADAAAQEEIRSYAYDAFLAEQHKPVTREALIVKCVGCGATTTLLPGVTADACPFCAAPLVVSGAESTQILRPHYVLPFFITRPDAQGRFKAWLGGLWFAPSDLSKRVAEEGAGSLKGVYLPYWSYDAKATTPYAGARGEYYYVTENYTVTVNGRTEQRSRQARHTRWHSARGTVHNAFSDVLVSASPSLPHDIAAILEPWELKKLARYDERYLGGFRSETYQTDAAAGLAIAKEKMDGAIREAILRDIGGDTQRIDSYDPQFADVALKYILLPVWISAYKYRGKLYRFVVNASTGEVTGKRPYSAVKIAVAVILVLVLLLLIWWVARR